MTKRIGGMLWWAGVAVGLALIAVAMTECSARQRSTAAERQGWFFGQAQARIRYHRYRHRRQSWVPPDCDYINDMAKSWGAVRFKVARDSATEQERTIIDRCVRENPGHD